MPETPPAADLRQLADFIKDNVRQPQVVSLSAGVNDGSAATALLVPTGFELKPTKPILDAFRDRPEQRAGTASMSDLASFNAWVNRHRDDHSMVFCRDDINMPALLAVIDYDRAGPELDDRTDVVGELVAGTEKVEGVHRARPGKHRAHFAFPKSRVFEEWRKASGNWLDQGEFAAFLERRLVDVLPPPVSLMGDGSEQSAIADPEIRKLVATLDMRLASPGDLQRFMRGIQVTVGRVAKQEINRDTGEATMVFQEQHEGEGPDKVRVPNLFLIAIPVLQNDPEAWVLAVHLRYRPGNGIKWCVELHEIERVWEKVVAHACQVVAETTTITPLRGWPSTKDG